VTDGQSEIGQSDVDRVAERMRMEMERERRVEEVTQRMMAVDVNTEDTVTPQLQVAPEVKNVRYPSGATRSADAEDVRFDLIPACALMRLAARYAIGSKAHGDRNWEGGMPSGVVLNHLERHLNLWKSGDRSDDHLAAAAWGCFALMFYEARRPEVIEEAFRG